MAEFAKVGLALAALRKAAGLRQRDVAERLGVRASTVGRFEGPNGNPRATSIDRYLEAIGCTPMDLARALQGETDRRPEAAVGTGSLEKENLAKTEQELGSLARLVLSLREEFYRFRDDVTLRTAREAVNGGVQASESTRETKSNSSSE